MKKISLLLCLILIMSFVIIQDTNPTLRYIKGQIRQLTNAKKFENVYVETDKTLYKQGETIWFSAFIRNATDLKNAESEVLYVELISPKGTVVVTRIVLTENQVATGDFQITNDFVGGIYQLKAYTKWMQDVQKEAFTKEIIIQDVVLPNLLMNLEFQRKAYGKGEKAFADITLKTLKNKPLTNHQIRCSVLFDGINKVQFYQTTDDNGKAVIQVDLPLDLNTNDGMLNVMIEYEGQTESISTPIPIILNNIDIQFLPESGNLLAGVENTVGFKAVNEYGNAADVEGAVYNQNDELITYFTSYHLGMGKFNFTPKKDETYYAKLILPRGIDKKINLPKVDTNTCIIQIKSINNINVNYEVVSNFPQKTYVLIENRGEVVATEALEGTTKLTTHTLRLSTKSLPIGMSRITVIDESYHALAQRLVFLNQDKQLDIAIETNKDKYLPREKVKATITVKDHRGNPVQGNFAMSVVDENLLQVANDKQANILSHILLQSDLKGQIEEPNFYFEKASANDRIDRRAALDLLMMTQGWRRYEWSNIRTAPTNVYQKKERKVIAGQVIDNDDVKNIIVNIEGSTTFTKTDYQGRFTLEDVDLYTPKVLVFRNLSQGKERKVTINRYKDDLKLYFYPVKGKIQEVGTNEPIPFAAIMIEGHNLGTTTDFDGYFDLAFLIQKAKELDLTNPTFRVSFVGYAPYRFTLEDLENTYEETFNILLEQNVEVLESVVIAAPSRMRNRDINIMNKEGRRESKKAQNNTPITKGKVSIDKFSIINENKEVLETKTESPFSNTVYYYKPRPFISPDYSSKKPKQRTDFQSTIYWNGNIQTDKKGMAEVEFSNVDAITTYRISVSGFGQQGAIGFAKSSLISTMPFAIKTKLPTHLTDGDVIDLPITLVNNSNKKLSGKLDLNLSSLIIIEPYEAKQTLKPNEAKTIFIKCIASANDRFEAINIGFNNGEWSDEVEHKIRVLNNHFPVEIAFADANTLEENYRFEVKESVKNSANVSIKLMTNVLSQIFTDLEQMLRMPSGCFEQTSSSNYPNVLALQYMRAMDKTNPDIEAKALKYLESGYDKLISYECKNGGFEWFGSDPAHEGLTAYGLMQFVDMQEVYPVSNIMINRTANWLLQRRDGKGGWEMNERFLHSWADNSSIYNAYITWAMTEAGYHKKLKRELDFVYESAIKTEDVYVMSLAANALLNANDTRGKDLLNDITLRQNEDGSWSGLQHSITHSKGRELAVETTSLVMLAMLKDNRNGEQIRKANDFLMQARGSYGFGNTQATVMALKAIIAYAKVAQNTDKNGRLTVYLNDDEIAKYDYSEAETTDVLLSNLVSDLPKGNYEIKVKFSKTKHPVPFLLSVNYDTRYPQNDDERAIELTTELQDTAVAQGETVRLKIRLNNMSGENQSNPIAIIGLPAGASPQLWQLKQLQNEGAFDYYESFDGYFVFYFRTIDAGQTKTINLDLKATLKGSYSAPASTAFLYYNQENRAWSKAKTLEIF